MTFANRYFVELSDILTVRFTCKKCKTTYSVTPEEVRDESYYRCYNCKEQFFEANTENTKAIRALFFALRELRSHLPELSSTIHLELEPGGAP